MVSTALSEYRKFIFSLCEELSATNLDSMKFLCRDILTTRELERIGNNAMDLVVLLEQRNELTSDNFHLLQDLLKQIRREDLVRKLKEFKKRQHGGKVHFMEPKIGSFGLNINNLQDYVTQRKLNTALSSSNSEDSQQAEFTPRGELYILIAISQELIISCFYHKISRVACVKMTIVFHDM